MDLLKIVPPILQTLHIGWFSTGKSWTTLLSEGRISKLLQSKLPLLKNLRLTLHSPAPLTSSDSVAPFSKLHSVKFRSRSESASPEWWRLFASMQSLEELDIYFGGRGSALLEYSGFLALKRLTLAVFPGGLRRTHCKRSRPYSSSAYISDATSLSPIAMAHRR
ncbi:hypothetical protein OBBRIDRAFT_173272 [Obba rivulosa]|uniref:Uncharacterized protein n=1 Tax=Obba rivulosa TaxID=1052685 RepID=A0A8E2APY7_9APHY|nr:hypothetical protein OBBRIDRAFT_173272 [Obba rivulosa]